MAGEVAGVGAAGGTATVSGHSFLNQSESPRFTAGRLLGITPLGLTPSTGSSSHDSSPGRDRSDYSSGGLTLSARPAMGERLRREIPESPSRRAGNIVRADGKRLRAWGARCGR